MQQQLPASPDDSGGPGDEVVPRISREAIYHALFSITRALDIRMPPMDSCMAEMPSDGLFSDIVVDAAQQCGVFLRSMTSEDTGEIGAFLSEGFPILVRRGDGSLVVLYGRDGAKYLATEVQSEARDERFGVLEVRSIVTHADAEVFVAKPALEMQALADAGHSQIERRTHVAASHDHVHEHASPLQRALVMVKMEGRDIFWVTIFGFTAAILTLATPLAIESLINVVSWGYYLQPLIVLGAILFICLSLAAVMRLLQIVVVEMIQRRQFVRFVGDLSHRFARVRQGALANEFPRELANRLFDIMTIQKATATLLIDGIGLILTTTLGLLLLAFYHPYLLGFDIVLFIAMVAVTRVLGWGGVRTAIDESIAKYRVVHWLQDVIASPSAFRIGGGEFLAVQRANELTMDYLQARSRQFRVLLRQIMFALTLQIFASTAVLALGGYLVMIQQLTLGQLVASEFVVTVVVGAFAKAGKSLEKFYDMMAGIDKVGHLVDLPTVHHGQSNEISGGPLPVRWDELLFEHSEHRCTVPATHVQPGQIVAVISDHVDDRADLAAALVGLQSPKRGLITIEGNSPENCVIDGGGQWIGYVSQPQIFHGTVRENISLGRGGVGQNRISQTMAMLGLDSVVLRLPDGIDTMLQTDGYPLSRWDCQRMMVARAIATRPGLVVIDGTLDALGDFQRKQLWDTITGPDASWTLVVLTGQQDVADLCDRQIRVTSG